MVIPFVVPEISGGVGGTTSQMPLCCQKRQMPLTVNFRDFGLQITDKARHVYFLSCASSWVPTCGKSSIIIPFIAIEISRGCFHPFPKAPLSWHKRQMPLTVNSISPPLTVQNREKTANTINMIFASVIKILLGNFHNNI